MSHLPAPRSESGADLPESLEHLDGEVPRHPVSWAALLRNRWIILGCTVVALAMAVYSARRLVPVYEGASTLRIEPRESSLPEAFRSRSPAVSWIPTEIEELQSRALAGEVAKELGLRLVILEPEIRSRGDLLWEVQVADSAEDGVYRLTRRPSGRVAILEDASGNQLASFEPESRVEFAGFGFKVNAGELPAEGIRIAIRSQTDAAMQVVDGLWAGQRNRDVNIVAVAYRSPDPDLAWRVPQALVTRYIAQRQELQTLELRSTIEYLKEQITAIASQLAKAEQELESYRRRNEVIAPRVEADNQITRLVAMQTERGLLEDERSAIAALLADVDATAAAHKAGQPSPYRRLLTFPKLLHSEAATGLLRSLTSVEDEREKLLARRTPEDSDVRALNQRIDELERELRGIAVTYHQGLTSHIGAIDGSLRTFRRQLQTIPEKELQYARLERQPKILESVYTMLQTRLKEAEVTVAARDPSVRIVDAAIPPLGPVSTRPIKTVMAALVFGLLVGMGIAFAREYLDRAVRTRTDVHSSTGLPVIGLIPRISRGRSSVALIAEPRRLTPAPRSAHPSPQPPRPRHAPPRSYTFLGTDPSAASAVLGTPAEVHCAPAPAPAPRMALSLSPKAAIVAEALGVLQTNIAFSLSDAAAKTLVFTSPLPGDGKTTTVVNLALSLAQRGIRVLLVDADVRRGVVHSIFQSPREPGLSEVLRGVARLESALRTIHVDDRGVVDYLTAGKFAPGDYGLVVSDAMTELLARVREEYEMVILDTPPVNVISDAAVLAAKADGVILVARVGVTDASALSYAVEQLGHVRATVLGVVLNDINLRRDAAYDRSYKYVRNYEYVSSES